MRADEAFQGSPPVGRIFFCTPSGAHAIGAWRTLHFRLAWSRHGSASVSPFCRPASFGGFDASSTAFRAQVSLARLAVTAWRCYFATEGSLRHWSLVFASSTLTQWSRCPPLAFGAASRRAEHVPWTVGYRSVHLFGVRCGRCGACAPRIPLYAGRYRISGVDLTRIDSISVVVAQTVISEVGLDMSRWNTEAHFASWWFMSR
jgi:hypothetical protein